MSLPWKLALGVYFTWPVVALTIVTVPLAPLVTLVMVRPTLSKASLPSTLVVTAVSSAVVAVSLTASASAFTANAMVRKATLPWLSLTRTVKLSLPL